MLKERIEILVQGSVISRQTGDFVNEVIDMLMNEYSKINEDGAQMFTTHLAMATNRVANQEPVEELDSELWKEVLKEKNFEKAVSVYERVKEMSFVNYPESEREFLVMHLCNVLH